MAKASSNELGPNDGIASPETVQNIDILDLCNRTDTYILEICQCASHTRHETSDADSARIAAMIARFRSRFEAYAADPELDMPKVHPRPLRMPQPPEHDRIENADLQQLINVWSALRIEMSFSDSAERSTGFKTADAERIDAVVTKLENLADLMDNEDEIDLPDVDRQDPPGNG
jgi:hypothetical protein